MQKNLCMLYSHFQKRVRNSVSDSTRKPKKKTNTLITEFNHHDEQQ